MNTWLEITDSLYELIKGIPWEWVIALLSAVTIVVWLIYRKSHIVVPDSEVAVVYNTGTHGFSRFLPPGRHMLIPGVERIRANISRETRETGGCCEGRTRDGYPIALGWHLAYHLAPLSIDPEQCADMAHVLLNRAQSVVVLEINDCLSELLEHYTLDHLRDVGIQNRVKRQTALLASDRINRYGVLIDRIDIETTKIPDEIEVKRLAQLVRAIRISKGDLSEAEIEHLIRLNLGSTREPVRNVSKPESNDRPPNSRPTGRNRSPDIDCQDSLVQTTIQSIDIPIDSSIGKIVV